MEEQEIVELFFQRSEQGIVELQRKYEKICKKISFNILNNIQDADECVNDAYLAVWNRIPPECPKDLFAYLCRIVRNLSIKTYRKNTALKRNSFYDVALHELEDCIPSSHTVEEEWDAKVLGEYLDGFLATLDGNNRVMFMRRYWFSEPLSDIAAAFQLSENNVAVRLSRTRGKLKKYLEKKGVPV